jgi:Family of unknown function (DUF5715)
MMKRVLLLILIIAAAGGIVWAVLRFTAARRHRLTHTVNEASLAMTTPDWAQAVERVKEDRGEQAGGSIEVPPELKHYSERYWFLATQVAEIEKYRVHTCQDYLDLARLIERREMVAVPAVTDTYVLYGVGARADDRPFSRYEGDHTIELYDETQLAEAYRSLAEKRSMLQTDIKSLNSQAGKLTKRERTKRKELQKQISGKQQELEAIDEEKALLDQSYGQRDSRQRLFREYESLQVLANNFNGRSFNINNPSDRQALKVNLLSALRPQAFKILEEVAASYHRQFNRPLPVSSLVRPEQYQHALKRVNRNAVLIETPPHSTGLAFDIDYRYMSGTEQTFLMNELARFKREGRIEVIRERSANYHVFAFVNGTRPSDDLITASLEEAGAPSQEAHHTAAAPAKAKKKGSKARKPHSNTRKTRKRRH